MSISTGAYRDTRRARACGRIVGFCCADSQRRPSSLGSAEVCPLERGIVLPAQGCKNGPAATPFRGRCWVGFGWSSAQRKGRWHGSGQHLGTGSRSVDRALLAGFRQLPVRQHPWMSCTLAESGSVSVRKWSAMQKLCNDKYAASQITSLAQCPLSPAPPAPRTTYRARRSNRG